MTHPSSISTISLEPEAPATTESQRPYSPPAVVYEASLEVRAGTPVGLPDLLELP